MLVIYSKVEEEQWESVYNEQLLYYNNMFKSNYANNISDGLISTEIRILRISVLCTNNYCFETWPDTFLDFK